MLVFLKNTVAQINVETRQGNAPVMRAQQAPASAGPEGKKHLPAGVDAVTSGTQCISHYFGTQAQVQTTKPDSDDT